MLFELTFISDYEKKQLYEFSSLFSYHHYEQTITKHNKGGIMKKLIVLSLIVFAFSLVFGMSAAPVSAKNIKIGVIGPMNFLQGKGHWNGALMARDEINADGGVQVGGKKMKIELV